MPAVFSHSGEATLLFDTPLLTATILNRPNRYVAILEFPDGTSARAHVPVGGRIGGLTLDGLPSLVSGPYAGRSTDYTVEAIGSHFSTDAPDFQWIGINQTASNGYMKVFLASGLLEGITEPTADGDGLKGLKPEVKLDGSRIDFFLPGRGDSNLWIEVKTPLIELFTSVDPLIPMKTDFGKGAPSGRLPEQMEKICAEIKSGRHRAVLLGVFGYTLDDTTAEERYLANLNLDGWVDRGKPLGLEFWEVNVAVSPEGVKLKSYQRLFNK